GAVSRRVDPSTTIRHRAHVARDLGAAVEYIQTAAQRKTVARGLPALGDPGKLFSGMVHDDEGREDLGGGGPASGHCLVTLKAAHLAFELRDSTGKRRGVRLVSI